MNAKELAQKLRDGQIQGSREAVERQLAKGISITYIDDAGRLVQEHPDGRIELIDRDTTVATAQKA